MKHSNLAGHNYFTYTSLVFGTPCSPLPIGIYLVYQSTAHWYIIIWYTSSLPIGIICHLVYQSIAHWYLVYQSTAHCHLPFIIPVHCPLVFHCRCPVPGAGLAIGYLLWQV